jgi:hypothetical protein
MKIKIKDKFFETYQLSNKEVLDFYNECDDEETKNVLLDSILSRYEYQLCPKNGENTDDVFARFFSDFVNGRMISEKHVAEKMSHDHRYLQNEMFKVLLEYIKILADNCERGYYDGRNKYAAETSKMIIDNFKENNYPY